MHNILRAKFKQISLHLLGFYTLGFWIKFIYVIALTNTIQNVLILFQE